LDNIMSDYNPGSELMLLCQRAAGPPIKISEDLFRVMAADQDWARRSKGAFDITVGPVVRLWRRARRQHELPESQRLAHALELVGHDKLLLDSKAHTAQLLKPGMLLDLGGIGKGYAADEALRTLKRFEIQSALIVAGGDIAVGDPPPGKEGWRIRIAAPQSRETAHDQSQVQNLKSEIQNRDFQRRYVYLHNAGISTSGDTEQHVEIGGTRYSHIVNPKTGLALTGRRSVTVIAPDDATADAMATAISVLGPKRVLELVNSTPGTAALISVVSDQGVQSFESNFPAMISRASRRKD
jgi:thiamine biosynthesis lipoprotein